MIRGIGLRGAVAVNVITMIGIGPLITIPLVLTDLHGSLALAGWVVGAAIALCDGLVWAELGSLYPGSGGTYVFLRETFGRNTLGRLLAFLFAWQIVLAAPLVLASGYIGFAHYAAYLWPALAGDARLQGAVAALVGILTLFALYRPIGRIASLGLALAAVATATLGAVIVATATHFDAARALSFDRTAPLGSALAAGLGPALVITLYDYYGYGQSCTVSDEVRAPARTLPRSVVLSILIVGALYIALQLGVLGVVPWRELVAATPGGAPPDAASFVASLAVERTWGAWAARIVTLAILVTAFASTFGNLLGYSRIPYAAAVDGVFFAPFARLHPRSRFPHVALLTIGLLALPPCFLTLGDVINALTTGLVIIQSLAQIAALVALRARKVRAPYRMALYPLPALAAAAGWIYIFCSAGTGAIAFGLLSLAAGVALYAWRAKLAAQWPFAARGAA
ncbi:MAG: APC family permease, partial [Candidatus Baltobacteraceae bacterium]